MKQPHPFHEPRRRTKPLIKLFFRQCRATEVDKSLAREFGKLERTPRFSPFWTPAARKV